MGRRIRRGKREKPDIYTQTRRHGDKPTNRKPDDTSIRKHANTQPPSGYYSTRLCSGSPTLEVPIRIETSTSLGLYSTCVRTVSTCRHVRYRYRFGPAIHFRYVSTFDICKGDEPTIHSSVGVPNCRAIPISQCRDSSESAARC